MFGLGASPFMSLGPFALLGMIMKNSLNSLVWKNIGKLWID